MSEQEQGAVHGAGAQQPRFDAHPPPGVEPAQPVEPAAAEVDDLPLDGPPASPRPDVADAPALEGEGVAEDQASPEPAVIESGDSGRAVGALSPTNRPDMGGQGPATTLVEATPEPVAPPEPGLSADAQAALEQITAIGADLAGQAEDTRKQLAALAAGIAEANRLRSRDQAHVEQLHTDNTSLRRGELTSAMAPLLTGLVRLSDQMASMAAGDKHSIAGMLRVQLMQTMDVAAGVTEFSPADGEAFDPKRMTGAGREDTNNPDQDGTVSRTVRSGFTRGDGSIVRVAEVVVRRQAPTHRPAGAGSEQ